MLALTRHEPVACGKQRQVFVHPENPDLIVKVIRPDSLGRAWGKWYKARRSSRQYLSYLREIDEYVTNHARAGNNPTFAQQVVGLAETDLGLGLVVRAVRGKDGGLAPSLKSMLKDGTFDSAAEHALELFFHDLLTSDMIAADLHSGNIVYAHDETADGHFVMIDGLGQHNLIPLKRLSRSLNRKGKHRRIAKLRLQISEAHLSRASRAAGSRARNRKNLRRGLLAACAVAALVAWNPFASLWRTQPETGSARAEKSAATPAAALSSYLPEGSSILEDGTGSGRWTVGLANGTVIRAADATHSSGTIVFGGDVTLENIPGIRLGRSMQLMLSPEGDLRLLGNPFPPLVEEDEDLILFADDVGGVIQ